MTYYRNNFSKQCVKISIFKTYGCSLFTRNKNINNTKLPFKWPVFHSVKFKLLHAAKKKPELRIERRLGMEQLKWFKIPIKSFIKIRLVPDTLGDTKLIRALGDTFKTYFEYCSCQTLKTYDVDPVFVLFVLILNVNKVNHQQILDLCFTTTELYIDLLGS